MSDARAEDPPRMSVIVGLGGRAILSGGVAVIIWRSGRNMVTEMRCWDVEKYSGKVYMDQNWLWI